jgi:hypothetical protein
MTAPAFHGLDDEELRRRFSGEVEAKGLKSWLGPMLERAHGMSRPPGGPRGSRRLKAKPPPRSAGPGQVGSVGLEWAARVDEALARMPPRLAQALAAHYKPEPPGCEGLEPRELRGLMLHLSGLSPDRLKALQARMLRQGGDAHAEAHLSALRLRCETTLAAACEAYARARWGLGHRPEE